MRFASFLAAGVCLGVVTASPAPHYIVHEKRNEDNFAWIKGPRVDHRRVLPMHIALKQQNLEKGDQWLYEVSDPTSPKYGQHWSPEYVVEMFKPSDETVNAVKTWLTGSGIAIERIKSSAAMGWLQINATVAEAEDLLKTKYHVFEHTETGTLHVACDSYSLPGLIKEHVDFVTPSVHFDAKIKRDAGAETETLGKRDDGGSQHWTRPGTGREMGWNRGHGWWRGPWKGKPVNPYLQQMNNLANCDKYITPDCLRALYQFGPGNPWNKPNAANSYGIVEYTPEAYLASDLDMFFRNFSPSQVGARPIFDSIDGGVNQQQYKNFSFNGEPDLDLEYAMTLVYPQQVTLYQVGDLVEGASFNNFLDALDKSYCGGDDPTQDGIYPDPLAGGYKGPEDCGKYAPAKVISTSYSYNEADLTSTYEMRQCNEYMKLGLLGTSILYSSGDYGVAGNLGQCIDPYHGNYTAPDGKYGIFNPSFPGTCPYITSVGATQVKNNTNIVSALASRTQPEMACETIIYSGGGFSNVFPLPSYQSAAVKGWFANHPPPYGAERFNNSQRTRGLPDVSANGANYVIAVDGNFSLVYGTSASSPTFGSIITLINEQRYNAGKKSVGFLNPTLYANPGVLNDITQGGNQGCGTPGFQSTTGWDPVTGLGTPNYPKMLNLFLHLP